MTKELAVKEVTTLQSEDQLKKLIATTYMKQIQNYFGDERQALRFLSGVVAATQRNPKLLECTPTSVINSFMTMAQLQLMPSDVSGEAYVIPYLNSKKDEKTGRWEKRLEAQFQIGYQGLVTLFYRAGVKQIVAEVVRQLDQFAFENGMVLHRPDVFSDDRGPAIGAYIIITLDGGGKITKLMSKKEIMEIAAKFSKSYASSNSPWDENKDPQLWMWKKTVLKQAAKLVPKNDAIISAIAEDNKDSNLLDVKPTFNLEDCQKKLEESKTTEELARNWSLLPAEAKLQLAEVKNEVKKLLTEAEAPKIEEKTVEEKAMTEQEMAELLKEDTV